MQKGLRR